MLSHDLRSRKVIPIHDAIPAQLSPEYRKGMEKIVTEGLAARISDVSQSLDINNEPAVKYDDLPGPEKARANDAARCAVKWCDPREHRDAELRLRQEITAKLYWHGKVGRSAFHQLELESRILVEELATACAATLRMHFDGTMSPLSQMERSELTGENGGEAA